MSLIIFFGLATVITLVGLIFIYVVAKHHWLQSKKNSSNQSGRKNQNQQSVENHLATSNEKSSNKISDLNLDCSALQVTNESGDAAKSQMQNLTLLLLFVIGFSVPQAKAWLQADLRPSMRTYPTGFSVTGTVKDDYLIWDQRDQQFWQFGLIKPQLSVGSHGMIEGSLSVYPISFVEIYASRAWTNRYYDTKPFNCDVYQCQGTVERQKWGVRMAVKFDSFLGPMLVVPSYQQVRLEGDDKKTVVDEEEVLLAHSGWDVSNAQSLFVGLKWQKDTTGIYYRQSQFQRTAARNQAQYLIHQFKYTYPGFDRPFDIMLGLGTYSSDFSDANFSAIAALSWHWGDSLALF